MIEQCARMAAGSYAPKPPQFLAPGAEIRGIKYDGITVKTYSHTVSLKTDQMGEHTDHFSKVNS